MNIGTTTLSLCVALLATCAAAQLPSLTDDEETTFLVVAIIIAVTSYISFIVSFFSDSFTYIETSLMAVILFSTCSQVSKGPEKMVDYIKYFVSPFIDLDHEIAILCNVGIIILVFLVHLLVAKVAQKSTSHRSFMETLGATYFPSVGMVLISHLFCGTALLSVSVFARLDFNSDIDVLQVVSSCIGLVFVVVVCVLWVLAIIATDLTYKLHSNPNFFSPTGYYEPANSRTGYRNLVGTVRSGGPMRLLLLCPLIVWMITAVFLSIPSTDISCTTRSSIVVAVIGLELLVILIFRPLRSLGLTLVSAVAHIGLILLIVATLVEESDGTESDTAKGIRIAGVLLVACCQITAIFAHIAIGCTEDYPVPVIGVREPFQYRY